MRKFDKEQQVILRVLSIMLAGSLLLVAAAFILPKPVVAAEVTGCWRIRCYDAPYPGGCGSCGSCLEKWEHYCCSDDPCSGIPLSCWTEYVYCIDCCD
jgi:hypothetical protein